MSETRNVYVGHRYVPKIVGEWDKNQSYEGLTIVTYQGASFTSKKRVPAGIDINDNEYWVSTGNYNAQVENYRQEVANMKEEVGGKADKTYVDEELRTVHDEVERVSNSLDKLKINAFSPPSPMIPITGDGITDDSIALQSMLDHAPENGIEIDLGTGKVLIENSLTFPAIGEDSIPVSIVGTNGQSTNGNENGFNRGHTTIIFKGTGALFDLSTVQRANISLKNLSCYYSGGNKDGTYGIKANDMINVVMDNVVIKRFDIGVKARFTYYTKWDNVGIYYCNIGLDLALSGGVPFYNCKFSHNGTGVKLSYGGSSVVFYNCYFEGNTVVGLLAEHTLQVDLFGCYFEANTLCIDFRKHESNAYRTQLNIYGGHYSQKTGTGIHLISEVTANIFTPTITLGSTATSFVRAIQSLPDDEMPYITIISPLKIGSAPLTSGVFKEKIIRSKYENTISGYRPKFGAGVDIENGATVKGGLTVAGRTLVSTLGFTTHSDATSVEGLIKTIRVYDENGEALGFIPVYQTRL